jgi:hypothetical protein
MPTNNYNSWVKGGKAHWLARGGQGGVILRQWVIEEPGSMAGWRVIERNQLKRLDLDLKN